MGIISCTYLMLSLPVLTWVRFLVWLDIGLLIYWFYGRTHSPLSDAREKAARTPLQSLANFVTLFGLLLIFNAACITALGYMMSRATRSRKSTPAASFRRRSPSVMMPVNRRSPSTTAAIPRPLRVIVSSTT